MTLDQAFDEFMLELLRSSEQSRFIWDFLVRDFPREHGRMLCGSPVERRQSVAVLAGAAFERMNRLSGFVSADALEATR
jgi:hypothetical protein